MKHNEMGLIMKIQKSNNEKHCIQINLSKAFVFQVIGIEYNAYIKNSFLVDLN